MGPNYHPELPRQLNEIRRQLLQHDVDIKRLWQLLQPKGEGWPVGGDGTGGPLIGPWTDHETSGGAECPPQNTKHQIALFGLPTSGTWTYKVTTSGGTNTTSGIAYNASAATIQTAIEGLACVGSGNVVCAGGSIDQANVSIEFQGALANEAIDLPILNWFNVSGGTGVGMVAWWDKVGRA